MRIPFDRRPTPEGVGWLGSRFRENNGSSAIDGYIASIGATLNSNETAKVAVNNVLTDEIQGVSAVDQRAVNFDSSTGLTRNCTSKAGCGCM